MSFIGSAEPRLDARDLELVLAVASAGSTVKAASRLHLTQSAVSRALLLVEDKLGAPLFERRARGVVPTAAGARLIAGAGAVLSQLKELEQRALAAERTAPLRLVCECYTAYRWLPSALAALRRGGAGLDVSIAFEHTRAPVAGLTAGEVDVALLTTARVPKSLVERPLFADEIVFVVAAKHPLAARRAIDRADLGRYPLITSSQTPEPEARWFLGRVFGRNAPRIEGLAFPLTEVIVDAARAGLGVAVLSEWIAIPYLGGADLVVRRLRGGPLLRQWRVAYSRGAAEAANRLVSALAGAAPRLQSAG